MFDLVDNEPDLLAVVDQLNDEPVYAVDTEFHRERTYYPKVALVQLAFADRLVIVDPMAVDIAPLGHVFAGEGLAVLHAAAQDLEVFDRSCGVVPNTIFDTQIAAGFLGLSSPSLASLHERELGKRLPKGDRLTDWLRRPLSQQQLDYAISDVADLLQIRDRLQSELEALDRLAWAMDECELLRQKVRIPPDPADAWARIKECRHLRGPALGVAQELAAWREERAAETDQPARFVLPDLALVGIAQRKPTSVDGLKKVRGLDGRHLRSGVADEILAVVQRGLLSTPRRLPAPRRRELDSRLRPAVPLVAAWVNQLARDAQIDPALVGTRADIEALLRGDEGARLTQGWRAELVGRPIDDLLSGQASLAFEPDHGLIIEPRMRLEPTD
ncbi:MAG: ribonuclease D [Acidimicrobiales bacterium]